MNFLSVVPKPEHIQVFEAILFVLVLSVVGGAIFGYRAGRSLLRGARDEAERRWRECASISVDVYDQAVDNGITVQVTGTRIDDLRQIADGTRPMGW